MTGGDDIRRRLAACSEAASDTAALHALARLLDGELAERFMLVCEGRRRALGPQAISSYVPEWRPDDSAQADFAEQMARGEAHLARVYWEHPSMIWSGIPK